MDLTIGLRESNTAWTSEQLAVRKHILPVWTSQKKKLAIQCQGENIYPCSVVDCSVPAYNFLSVLAANSLIGEEDMSAEDGGDTYSFMLQDATIGNKARLLCMEKSVDRWISLSSRS